MIEGKRMMMLDWNVIHQLLKKGRCKLLSGGLNGIRKGEYVNNEHRNCITTNSNYGHHKVCALIPKSVMSLQLEVINIVSSIGVLRLGSLTLEE